MIQYNHIHINDPYNHLKIFASSVATDIVLRAVNPLQIGKSTKLSNPMIEHSTASETRDFSQELESLHQDPIMEKVKKEIS